MYIPPYYRWDNEPEIMAFIEQITLGTLISCAAVPMISEIPFFVDVERHCLVGHLAKNNPHVQRLQSDAKCLLLFRGAHGYISPNDYLSEQVPTWNYTTVEITGRARLIDDATALTNILQQLTAKHEASFEHPWTTDKIPERHLQAMLSAIIGLEIDIDEINAKRKLSQNRTAADRVNAIQLVDRRNPFLAKDMQEVHDCLTD